MLSGVILYHRFICVCVLKCKGVLIPLKGLADNLFKTARTFGSEPQGIESRVASINRQHPRPRWSIQDVHIPVLLPYTNTYKVEE